MTSYGPVERATRAELRALGVSVQSSSAAAAMIAVAKRLDATTGAASAAAAARELRLGMSALACGLDDPLMMDPEIVALVEALR